MMLKENWIEGIKKAWLIDDETLRRDEEAVRKIQKNWRAYRFIRIATRRAGSV